MPKSSMGHLTIYADGGARGNPGPAGIGAVFFDSEGNKFSEISKYIGTATNNVAEYLAAIYALLEASWLHPESIELRLDSQLVVRQLNGEYKVRDKRLKKFHDICLHFLKRYDKFHIVHIPRKENKEADKLVNKALDLRVVG